MKKFKKICAVLCIGLISLVSPFSIISTDNPICPEPVPTSLSFDNEFDCSDAVETQSLFYNFNSDATSGSVAISGPSIIK